MASIAPDCPTPALGWRVWNVVEDGGALRLCSLLYRQVWRPGEEAVARCRRPLAALPRGRLPLHGPPSRDCVCGIYALKAAAGARPYLTLEAGHDNGSPALRVLGRVALWGRVVEAEYGWRASYGYPVRLLVPVVSRRLRLPGLGRRLPPAAEIAAALAAYGVPVSLIDRSQAALEDEEKTHVALKLTAGKPMNSPWAERLQLGESSSHGTR